MPYDFDKTHDLILKSARTQFLAEGFRGASIRTICREAGVTNGAFYAHFKSKDDLFSALVEDCLNQFHETYRDMSDITIRSADDAVRVFELSYLSAEALIHYVYQNSDVFTLLIKASAGTSYEHFTDSLVQEESRNTMAFLESCRTFMRKPENISERLARISSEAVIRSMLEAFASGESEEDNIRNTRLVSDYCIAGFRELLGL